MRAAALAVLDLAAQTALADCERRIERGLRSFVDIGQALAEIRNSRLYRETHSTFDAYCRERWEIGRDYADRMIVSADVVLTFVGTGLPAPEKESQARALARVPEPERVEVWREAVERTNGKPTAEAIRDARKRRTQTPARRDPTEAARASAVATPGGPDQIPGPAGAADCPPADPGTTQPALGDTPTAPGHTSDGETLASEVWRLLSSDPRKALTVGDLGCRLPDDASAVAVRYALREMQDAEHARTVCAVGPDGREWWWRAMPDRYPAPMTAVEVFQASADGAAATGVRRGPVAAFHGRAAPAPPPVTTPGGGVTLAPHISGRAAHHPEYVDLLAEVVAGTGGPAERVDRFEQLLADAVQAHRPWASEVDRACRRAGLAQEIARYEASR